MKKTKEFLINNLFSIYLGIVLVLTGWGFYYGLQISENWADQRKAIQAGNFAECIDRVMPDHRNTLWCFETMLEQY